MPDRIGLDGALHILEMARSLKSDDLLLCLLSGGGSALLNLPLPGIALAEKQMITRDLLSSGATIDEINTVRKHLSAIKGGRLAAASYPASTFTLFNHRSENVNTLLPKQTLLLIRVISRPICAGCRVKRKCSHCFNPASHAQHHTLHIRMVGGTITSKHLYT